MPTALVDHTSERKGEVWGGFGIGCVLKQHLTGTVCFPAGAQFGCGDEKEVGVEKEESLELKIGAEHHGIGVDLTIGTKTTKSEKWTIKSERCQWCKPEICFPNSRIEAWTCSTLLTLYYHNYDKTYFYPGPISQDLNNCGPDRDGHCNCSQEELMKVGAPSGEHSRGEAVRTASPAMLIAPSNFSRQDQATVSDPTQAMDAFASLYQQDVMSPKFGGEQYSIGIDEPGEPVNWLYPASCVEPARLSLLSRRGADLPPSRGPSLFRGRFLPVLAATRCLPPNGRVEISATVLRPSKPVQSVPAEPVWRTGFFTLIWAELDFGTPLEKESKISLLIKVLAADNCVLGYLSRNFVVLA
jgi:hypothetical protein